MSARTVRVEPMKYHGPGWNCVHDGIEHKVWGPNEKRGEWAAHRCRAEDGDPLAHESGASAAEAMAAAGFPSNVAAAIEFLCPDGLGAEMDCASCGSKDGIYSEDGWWTCNECGDEVAR